MFSPSGVLLFAPAGRFSAAGRGVPSPGIPGAERVPRCSRPSPPEEVRSIEIPGGDEVTKSEYFDEYFRRFFGSFGGSENSFLCNDIDHLCTVYAGFPSISCHFLATDYTKEEFCIIGLFRCRIVKRL